MTYLLLMGIPFVAGLAFGAGGMMIALNQRKIKLDPVTNRFALDADDLSSGDNSIPIGIVDQAYHQPQRFAEVGMLKQDQHDRILVANHVVNALNSYPASLDL